MSLFDELKLRGGYALMEDVARMMREMGFVAPHMGEMLEDYAPKLYTFVKAMYDKHIEVKKE